VLRTLQCAAEFAWRVLGIVGTFPALLAWLVYQPPGVRCEHRRKCAQDLMGSSDRDLLTELGPEAGKFIVCFINLRGLYIQGYRGESFKQSQALSRVEFNLTLLHRFIAKGSTVGSCSKAPFRVSA